MKMLFINAAYRDGSRTFELARAYLDGVRGQVETVDLGEAPPAPLDALRLSRYLDAVATQKFDDGLFDAARQFAAADEIVICAPYWNNSVPAALHSYIELVCAQGVSFDILPDGTYVGLVKARRLVFITTAGGIIPEHNFAYDYVASLACEFWHIPQVVCYKAENLDVVGFDVEGELARVKKEMGDARRVPVLRDCVYGQAVGDALGVPYEFLTRGTFSCTGMAGFGSHSKAAGTWSDDTSLALATCDSIRELGHIDTTDMRRRFGRWYGEGAYTVDGLFDVGNTTARALMRGAGQAGEYDNGNGSLMRILPLAFTGATDDEVAAVSAITHAHHVSTDACVRIIHIARRLIAGETPTDVAGELVDVPEGEIGSGGYVLDTYRAALWCLVNTSSYRDCVLAAVNLGDDSDTTGAVAGGLAGIVYGYDAIPEEWLETLRGKDLIDHCLFPEE